MVYLIKNGTKKEGNGLHVEYQKTEREKALDVITSKYENINCVYICERFVKVDGGDDFTMVEFYIDFPDEVITNELREEVNDLFPIDNESETVYSAYVYEGILPKNMEVTRWTRN